MVKPKLPSPDDLAGLTSWVNKEMTVPSSRAQLAIAQRPHTPQTQQTEHTEQTVHTITGNINPTDGVYRIDRTYQKDNTPNTHNTPNIPPNRPTAINVTDKQALVLETMIINPTRLTSLNMICGKTGMSWNGVRLAIKGLKTKGFVTGMFTVRDADHQGFRYHLDDLMCRKFMDYKGSIESTPQTQQTTEQTVYTEQTQQTTSSSSSFLSQKPSSKTVDDIVSDYEFQWWSEHGVDRKQVEAWMREFQLDGDMMFLSLSHARFDMRNRDSGREVKSPKDYLYATAKKTDGMYSKPKGYKSAKQVRCEMLAAQEMADEEAERKLDGIAMLKNAIKKEEV